jgi:hypothetical protein
MISARPLDSWIGGAFVVEDDPRNITALDAIRLQDATWRPANDLQPLAWQFKALWFALFTYYEGLPVTDLKQAIDAFMRYVVNAAMILYIGLASGSSKFPEYTTALRFGAQSDLRHAGLGSWGKNGPPWDLIRDGRLFDFRSYALPTNLQWQIDNNPGGKVAKQYHYQEKLTDYYD